MSLKNYLFLLVGALIVLLATIQITLVILVNEHINRQVDTKARFLSKQVIDVAIERISPDHAVIKTKQTNQGKDGHTTDSDVEAFVVEVPEGINRKIVVQTNGNLPDHAQVLSSEDTRVLRKKELHKMVTVLHDGFTGKIEYVDLIFSQTSHPLTE